MAVGADIDDADSSRASQSRRLGEDGQQTVGQKPVREVVCLKSALVEIIAFPELLLTWN